MPDRTCALVENFRRTQTAQRETREKKAAKINRIVFFPSVVLNLTDITNFPDDNDDNDYVDIDIVVVVPNLSSGTTVPGLATFVLFETVYGNTSRIAGPEMGHFSVTNPHLGIQVERSPS